MNRKKTKAFTLVEVMIALMILGIAIVSLIAANSSMTTVNGAGIELSTAEFLIEQIREYSAVKTFNNIAALNGSSFSPPIDATGEELSDMTNYQQQITVVHVQNTNLELIDAGATSDFLKITVEVSLNNEPISSCSWIKAKY